MSSFLINFVFTIILNEVIYSDLQSLIDSLTMIALQKQYVLFILISMIALVSHNQW